MRPCRVAMIKEVWGDFRRENGIMIAGGGTGSMKCEIARRFFCFFRSLAIGISSRTCSVTLFHAVKYTFNINFQRFQYTGRYPKHNESPDWQSNINVSP